MSRPRQQDWKDVPVNDITMQQEASLPSQYQIVSLSMVYRVILKLLFALPIVILSLPVLLRVTYFVVDRLTNNHTLTSLFITWSLTMSIRKFIEQSAPSPEDAQKAVAKTQVELPLFVFVVTALFINYLLAPLEKKWGIENENLITTWSPTMSFVLACRLAVGMILLGSAVILRYVGPPSVVRCSSSPLFEHPVDAALRKLRSQLSVEAFITFLAQPSEQPGELIHNPFEYGGNARRLQRPSLKASFSQILISLVIGCMVAYTSVIPWTASVTHGDSPYMASSIFSCIVANFVHWYQTTCNGAHELNPNRYTTYPPSWNSSLSLNSPFLRSVVILCLSFLCLAFVASIAVVAIDDSSPNWEGYSLWSLVFSSLVSGLAVTFYLHWFDETLRTALFSTPTDMRRVVEELADDDKMETYLDVAMHSVLHADSSLVRTLSSSSNPGLDNDKAELRRNDEAIKAMSSTLLKKTSADETGAHFEEDILRLAILASVGGVSRIDGKRDNLDKADIHHQESIKQWIQPNSDKPKTGGPGEPLVVPFVRALCAYAGGLGEALTICAGQKNPSTTNLWILPPGANVCAQYAVRAAARCIIFNLSTGGKLLADWRSTHLSLLIPAFLTSVCRLESGMEKFTLARCSVKPSDHLEKAELFSTESPELLPLFYVCNDSAVQVLSSLLTPDGYRSLDFPLGLECQNWIDKLLSRMQDVPKVTHTNALVIRK